MSRRPPRVPATYAGRLGRLLAVAAEHAQPGRVYVQPVAHDDDCPALRTQSLRDCRCEPWFPPPAEPDDEREEPQR